MATSPTWALPAAAQVPVVLIGDIDRGGVLASLVGTVALLEPEERALLKGFLVNKFRGDLRLFDGGRKIICERTGLADLGVVPWFSDAVRLPAEDAMALTSPSTLRGRVAEGGRRKTNARPNQDRRPAPLPHRQFRRSRSLARRAGRDRRDRAARKSAARRCRSDHPAGIEIHCWRSRLPARAGLGYRSPGPSPARRLRARTLRRLSDARPQPRRSPGHRGAGRARRRPGAAGYRHAR